MLLHYARVPKNANHFHPNKNGVRRLHNRFAINRIGRLTLLGTGLASGIIVVNILISLYRKLGYNKDEFYTIKSSEKTNISDDLINLRLELSRPLSCQAESPFHIIVKDNDSQIYRFYTPLRASGLNLELVVRVYKDGLISNLLNSPEINSRVSVSGLKSMHHYEPNTVKNIVMIAGGTGILPLYQLVARILNDPTDKTNLLLVWACKKRTDFFLKSELYNLKKKHPERLRFVLLNTGETPHMCADPDTFYGKLSESCLKPLLSPAQSHSEEDTFVIVCGPGGLCEALIGSNRKLGILNTLGYKRSQISGLWEGS